MNSINLKQISRKRVLLFGVVILAVLGIAAFLAFGFNLGTQVDEGQTAYETSPVRTGNLVISASGSGTSVAGKEVGLAFSTSGTVAAVNVQVGDQVKAGDVLAELEDDESLQIALLEAQVNLESANQNLEDLKTNAQVALAEAQIAVVDAQESYDEAKSGVIYEGEARCDDDTTKAYYQEYWEVQQKLDRYSQADYDNATIYLNEISPLVQERNTKYATYQYCANFTEYEIAGSQAELTKAEADLAEAKATLTDLQDHNGIDPDELALAENKVKSAQIVLDNAQSDLDGIRIIAPFDGTVLSIEGEAGNTVSTSTFITMGDLSHPNVEFYVDETDMDKVAIGYSTTVVFDAFPDTTYNGEVVQVNPFISSSGNSNVLKGLVKIELQNADQSLYLPEGLNASVEIIGGQANNAVLVSVDALHKQEDGSYMVYLLENGKPVEQAVEVGLMDYTYAQITSGLSLGQEVITQIVESK